ncbi:MULTISPECIES: hypothetical protein [Bradyrhizobium]|uniref:hypothetical protein n=1 Tax=Bradyrhizobium TaxID=374 RepID=UPI001144C778|nr:MULTISPECIES: hypothetical protein [Bradyrhizobium]QOG21007.1 hypothetical protein FOM02_30410 [Bradyrhizobium sp. SEMIA]UFW51416.1 hypothetical protein BaraCB756_10725 [Bradyrhizobium arachidis]
MKPLQRFATAATAGYKKDEVIRPGHRGKRPLPPKNRVISPATSNGSVLADRRSPLDGTTEMESLTLT